MENKYNKLFSEVLDKTDSLYRIINEDLVFDSTEEKETYFGMAFYYRQMGSGSFSSLGDGVKIHQHCLKQAKTSAEYFESQGNHLGAYWNNYQEEQLEKSEMNALTGMTNVITIHTGFSPLKWDMFISNPSIGNVIEKEWGRSINIQVRENVSKAVGQGKGLSSAEIQGIKLAHSLTKEEKEKSKEESKSKITYSSYIIPRNLVGRNNNQDVDEIKKETVNFVDKYLREV